MAKRLKKKKSSAKKSAARKPRAARKALPRRPAFERLRAAGGLKGGAWHTNCAAFAEIQTTDHRVACDSAGSESSREEAGSVHPQAESKNSSQLRDAMVDSMAGVAQGTLRSRAEGSEASAFGMHQADAGSDAYDRDFALSLLSQEQDALYEIDEALKRIELGTYGKCEMSGKPIRACATRSNPVRAFHC